MTPRYLLSILAVVAVTEVVDAQWVNYKTPGVPRTADGQPKLDAPTPRALDGHPDLSGVWEHDPTPLDELRRLFGPRIDQLAKLELPGMEISSGHKYGINILVDFTPEQVAMRAAAEEALRRRAAARDPARVCMDVLGFPFAGIVSPFKIVQAPRDTIVLYEEGSLHRQVFSDGRTLPKEFDLPAFLGYSVGSWSGDVFVVETAGFNDRTALDGMGHPHSEELRINERFHRRDFGHLDIEMTFDDPKMYTKPFTISISHHLLADGDIFESFCENEKDSAHLRAR